MKGFNYYTQLYEEYLIGINLQPGSIEQKLFHVKRYLSYLKERNIADVKDVDSNVIVSFAQYLKDGVSVRTGKPYSGMTIKRACCEAREFYSFLFSHDMLVVNPFDDVDFHMRVTVKRREIFTVEEMDCFLNAISLTTPDGLMQRALFEFMYATGLRGMEVSNMKRIDVDLSERIALVKHGKGRKDRYVPFSDCAYYFLRRYLSEVRPARESRVNGRFKGHLFLTMRANINAATIRAHFRAILKDAGLTGKKLTLHSIRHSCATHLLEAGADVRYVQELLGHEEIQTTVKYTHLMIDKLKKIYKTYHPRENDLFEEIDDAYESDIDGFIAVVKKQRKRYERERRVREKRKK